MRNHLVNSIPVVLQPTWCGGQTRGHVKTRCDVRGPRILPNEEEVQKVTHVDQFRLKYEMADFGILFVHAITNLLSKVQLVLFICDMASSFFEFFLCPSVRLFCHIWILTWGRNAPGSGQNGVRRESTVTVASATPNSKPREPSASDALLNTLDQFLREQLMPPIIGMIDPVVQERNVGDPFLPQMLPTRGRIRQRNVMPRRKVA
jgi:hypothetical protein